MINDVRKSNLDKLRFEIIAGERDGWLLKELVSTMFQW